MKLTEFNNTTLATAKKALTENYNLPFNVGNLSPSATNAMLQKVRGLISETRESSDFYSSQNNPAYMKLMFMSQALTNQMNEFRSRSSTRIVVENEEVEKSQVVLAAQDMVDSIQKMLEQVSDMLVKEMPALVDSIQSEIGVNESEQFSSQAGEALTSLTAALTQSKTALQGALGVVTGQGGMGAPAAFGDEDMGDAEMAPPEEDIEDSFPPEEEELAPEEELAAPAGNVGRARR